MSELKNPKYDNDLVNLGYLKELLTIQKKVTEAKILEIPKNYGSPPAPPYYVNETWTNGKKLYKCIKSRLTGSFTLSDWMLIVDGGALVKFIDDVYTIEKIDILNQLDNKIESYSQEEDPSIEWTTDLEKEKHKGDFWRKPTQTEIKEYIWTKHNTNPISFEWVETAGVTQQVYDLIDSKKSIFSLKPSSYNKNDLWVIEETILPEDIPEGVSIGDWVLALQDSNVYDKVHWKKFDKNVNIEYIENNYSDNDALDQEFINHHDTITTEYKNEIKKVETKWQATFKEKGGNNLLEDSTFVFGTWTGPFEIFNSTEAKNKYKAKQGIYVRAGTLTKTITPVTNEKYTFSFLFEKKLELANVSIKINDVSIDLTKPYTFSVTNNAIKIEIISDTNNAATLGDLMFNYGIEASPYSKSANEIITGSILMGNAFLEIASSESDVKFNAQPDGIRIKEISSGNTSTEFTKKGTITNEIKANEGDIAGLIFTVIGGQPVITR